MSKQHKSDCQLDNKLETTLPSLQELLAARVLRPGHLNLKLLIEDGVEVLGSLSSNGKIRASNNCVFESAEAWCREWLCGSEIPRSEAYRSVLFYREPILAFCPGHSDNTSYSSAVPSATVVKQMSRETSSEDDEAVAEIETGGVSDCSDSAPEEDNKQHGMEDFGSQSHVAIVSKSRVSRTVQLQESESDAETYFSEGSPAKTFAQPSKAAQSPKHSTPNKNIQSQNLSKSSTVVATLHPANVKNVEKISVLSKLTTVSFLDEVNTKLKLKKFRAPFKSKVQNSTSNDHKSLLRSQKSEVPVKGKPSNGCVQGISVLRNSPDKRSPSKVCVQELPLSNSLEPVNKIIKVKGFEPGKLVKPEVSSTASSTKCAEHTSTTNLKQKDAMNSSNKIIKEEHCPSLIVQNVETRKLYDESSQGNTSTRNTDLPTVESSIKTMDFKINTVKPRRLEIEKLKEEHPKETKCEEMLHQDQCPGAHLSPEVLSKLKAKTASLVQVLDNQQGDFNLFNSGKDLSLSHTVKAADINIVEDISGEKNVVNKATEEAGEVETVSVVHDICPGKSNPAEENHLITEIGKFLQKSSVSSGEAIVVTEASQNMPEFTTEEEREAWRNLTKARMFASWNHKVQAWGIVSATPTKQPIKARPIPRYTPTHQAALNSQESEPTLRELAVQVRDLQEMVSQLSGSGSISELSQATLRSSSSTLCHQSQDLFGSQDSVGGSQGVGWQASHARLGHQLRGSQGSQEPQQNQARWSQEFTPNKTCTSIRANNPSTNFKITPVNFTEMHTPKKFNSNVQSSSMKKIDRMVQPYPVQTPIKSTFQQRNLQIKSVSNFEQPVTMLNTRSYTPLKIEANRSLTKCNFQQKSTPVKLDLKTSTTKYETTNTSSNSFFRGGITPTEESNYRGNKLKFIESKSKDSHVILNSACGSRANSLSEWENSSRWQSQSEVFTREADNWGDKPFPAE